MNHRGIDWDAQPLGDVSDRELARRLGVHRKTVQTARKARGKAAATERPPSASSAPSAPAPQPPLAAARPSSPGVARPLFSSEQNAADSAHEPPGNGKKMGTEQDTLLAKFLRQPRTLAELCDHLDCGPSRAQRAVDDAKRRGMPVDFQGDRIVWSIGEERPTGEKVVSVAPVVGGWHTFAVVGDTHFGSKYCRDDYLADFCKIAYSRGVRTFFQVGDLLDGEYRHGLRELRAHGFDEQADEAIAKLPRMDGARWLFIDGNHDHTLSHAAGLVCGRAVVDRALRLGRTDMEYLGQRRGLVRLDCGASHKPLVELWHPKKGPSYAESYGLQKRCEAYHPGQKPDFLLAGHWHQFAYIVSRGIHAVSCGTFQGGGSDYSNALGTPQAIGSSIISFTLTEHGTVRQVALERINYYERESARVASLS